MKTASGALEAFLFTKQAYVYADLHTLTIPGGTVVRWTNADIPITFGGHTWTPGPTIKDGGVKQTLGTAVSTFEITYGDTGQVTINSIPLITFARRNGLDGAVFLVERLFFPAWDQTPIDKMIRFSGRFSEISDIGISYLTISVNSWTEVLDTNVPTDVWQASCLNTVYDAKCAISQAAFKASVAVVSGSTLILLKTNYGGATGVMTLGSLKFTNGANNGLRRTIKDQTAGNLTLVSPLPVLPAVGDTLELYPGCDLSQATCSAKFANLINFRGQPYVPIPETAI